MTIAAHPINKFLADDVTELHAVDLDDKALENIMNQEDQRDDLFAHILSPTRIVSRADYMGEYHVTEKPGRLTSRIFTLLEETNGCVLQSDFRDRVEDHPAFALIKHELRSAWYSGTLDEKFDLLDSTGAVAVFERAKKVVTIGFNATTMRSKIRESKAMVDIRNARIIDRLNGVPAVNFDLEPKKKVEPHVEMSTTFYISFKL